MNGREDVIHEIKTIVMQSKQQVALQVNIALLETYWNVGRVIIEGELKNQSRADYGSETLKILAKTLSADLGKVFFAVTSTI